MEKVIDYIIHDIVISWNATCTLIKGAQDDCETIHGTMVDYHDKFLEIMERLPAIIELANYNNDENIRILTDISQYIFEFQETGVEHLLKNPPTQIYQ